MPVNGTLTQKIEVLNEITLNDANSFADGTFNGVAYDATPVLDTSNVLQNGRLVLKKYGKDFTYIENKQTDFTTAKYYKSMVNLVWGTDSTTGITGLKVASGQTTGYRIIELDLNKLVKYGRIRVKSTGGASTQTQANAFKFQASLDGGTTWLNTTTITNYDNSVDVVFSGLTVGQDMTNKKLQLKQNWTAAGYVLSSMTVEAISQYYSSGTYVTPVMPLSDVNTNPQVDKNNAVLWPRWGTAYRSSSDINSEYTIDGGKTWKTTYAASWPTEVKKAKFIQYRFTLNSSDAIYSPSIYNFENKYWSEMLVASATTTATNKDKIKEFSFVTKAIKGIDAAWSLLTPFNAFSHQVRYTQTVNSTTITNVGMIYTHPRTVKMPGFEEINVTCYDLGYISNDITINDNFPVYGYNFVNEVGNPGSGIYAVDNDRLYYDLYNNGSVSSPYNFETWHEIVAYMWAIYSPEYINLKYGTGFIETCNLPVVEIGARFDSLYDVMEKICYYTGWTWEMDGYNLRFYQPKVNISSIVLQQDKNVIGSPQISDTSTEVKNVVIIPVSTKQRGFSDIQDIYANQATYSLQYFPIITKFQTSDGTQVVIDPEPVVYKWNTTTLTYDALVTYAEDYQLQQGEPAARAWYNVDLKRVSLVTTPTTGIKNGLKVIYNCAIENVIRREDRDSIAMFGTKEQFIGTQYSREEAEKVAEKTLFEKSFPMQPVILNVTDFGLKVGDYVQVTLDDQDINQIMPVTEIATASSPMRMDVAVTLNKAPVTDADLIVDIFKRLKDVEKKTVENQLTNSRYTTLEDDIEFTDEIFINGTYQWEV